MDVTKIEPAVNKVMTWCWTIVKRRLGPDAALFEEGDTFLKLSSKYVPLDAQKQLKINRIREFPCGIANCSQVFDSLSKYEAHYNSNHRNVCQMCHRILPTSYLLDVHIQETHDVMFALLAEKQHMYQCLLEHCQTKFKDTGTRRNHMVKVHKYPSNYRYDQRKQKSSQKKKEHCQNREKVAMETEPVPVANATSGEVNKPESCQTSSGRSFTYKVPKNICFGQGVSRGFLGGRGKGRGKHSKKKHWYNNNEDENMDTSVDIERVDMTELSAALD